MTVLVTGGCGYIGSHMVHELADAGEQVIVLDNLSTGFRSALPEGVPLYVGDVGDSSLVSALIGTHGIKSIIHFAASIVVPDSVRQPLDYYRNNTVNTRALLEAAVDCGVEAFHLLLDRRRLRQSGRDADRRTGADHSDVALRLVQADERDHAA